MIPKEKWNQQIYAVSEKISDKTACLIEPFTVGCRAARRSRPKEGENAIVFGAGTIGIAAAIALKYFGTASSALGQTADVDILAMTYGQHELIGSGGYMPEDVRDVMAIMESESWDIESIITHEFAWEELKTAIETAADVEHSLNVVIRYE